MIISLIAALDKNRVIGNNGGIPWRLPADLIWFKALTMGRPIIMGRRTHESIGRPLPGRQNIVVTRNRVFQAAGCLIAYSLDGALLAAGEAPEVMIIGGAELYAQSLPHANRLYLTFVEAQFEGDVYFPVLKREEWLEMFSRTRPPDGKHPYSLRWVIFERKKWPAPSTTT